MEKQAYCLGGYSTTSCVSYITAKQRRKKNLNLDPRANISTQILLLLGQSELIA